VGATVGSFLNVIIFPSASDLGVPWRVVWSLNEAESVFAFPSDL
jgi:hypothetical protein